MPYSIEYSSEAAKHLRILTAQQRTTVVNRVEEQLAHQPTVETRNRKLLRPNPIATWELRIGSLRVYYTVVDEPELLVSIQAVGVKERNQIRIGGKVTDL